jgi:DNA-binding MarR family transcriptional regulator
MSREENLRRIERAMVALNRIARSGRGDTAREERAGVAIPGSAQRVLYQLVERGEARLTELAQWTGSDHGILSRQVDLLEKEELLERRADPRDGRARVLHVTARGRGVSARLRRVQDETFSTLLRAWSSPDLKRTAELMERLVDSLHEGGESTRA